MTPREKTTWFFASLQQTPLPEDAKEFLRRLVGKTGGDKVRVWKEVAAFLIYWTEKSHDGKKERWELQKTFEVDRRLTTWFSRAGKHLSEQAPRRGKKIIHASDFQHA